MCVAEAGPVVAMSGVDAVVDISGRHRRISLAPVVLDGGRVEIGDWVLVHTGLAVAVVDEPEGRAVQALLEEARGRPIAPRGGRA